MSTEWDAAHSEARLIWEAVGAAHAASEGPGSRIDNLNILLRLAAPKAIMCEHMQGPRLGPPAPIYLHAATRVHQCGACANSDETRRLIDEFVPKACDSCGKTTDSYSPCSFVVSNIVVDCYLCDECRHGRRPSVPVEMER